MANQDSLEKAMRHNSDETVLVVDDDEAMRIFLSETLISAGYRCRMFSDGSSAIAWLASGEEHPDLLLSDIKMPGMSGLDLLRTVRTLIPELPVILLSGLCDLPTAQGALRALATDYLLKPVRPAELLELISRHLHAVHSERFEAVRAALRVSLAKRDSSGGSQAGQLFPIFDSLGLKSIETLQHSQRVAAYALLIGRDLGLDRNGLRALELGALLHDIGKAGIPHNVLMKAGKLTPDEWSIMKMHPQLGLDLLNSLPGLDRESQIVYSHHERFDGNGYPRRLAGEAIPLTARVFSIGDTFDAMTSNRVYRPGQTYAAARDEIHRVSGPQFDPSMVKLFDRVSDPEFEAVQKQFPDLT
jgi:putative nucleotidyltransferase with HDIG domain